VLLPGLFEQLQNPAAKANLGKTPANVVCKYMPRWA